MFEARNLSCTRGERSLFRGVSFRLEAGGLLHVAGTNGSGKTSLLRILCGLGARDGGAVFWRGDSIDVLREAYAREAVYIGHANALKDDLSTTENLQFACALAGHAVPPAAAREALAAFGLAACLHLPVRALSQGQKRRTVLARLVLSGDLPLWILDEPFSALDAGAVEMLEQRILAHTENGGIVVFTTHQDGALGARATQRLDLDAEGAAC